MASSSASRRRGNVDPAPPPRHPEALDSARVAATVPRLPPPALFARKLGRAPGIAPPNPSPPQPQPQPQVPPVSSSSSSSTSRRRRRRRRPRRGGRNAEASAEEARDWAQLPLDAIFAVLRKLDHIEILMGPGQVCRSWRRAARDDPSLWRRIDMRGHADLEYQVNLYGMAQTAIRRAKGQCEAFWTEYAADDNVRHLLGDQSAAPVAEAGSKQTNSKRCTRVLVNRPIRAGCGQREEGSCPCARLALGAVLMRRFFPISGANQTSGRRGGGRGGGKPGRAGGTARGGRGVGLEVARRARGGSGRGGATGRATSTGVARGGGGDGGDGEGEQRRGAEGDFNNTMSDDYDDNARHQLVRARLSSSPLPEPRRR
ncbi:hypothetical protein EJB05_09623, partial [Eragrostis curvula]